MAKKKDFNDKNHFSNRRSFDGQPLKKGQVLVPFRKKVIDLKEGEYVQENYTTAHYGCIKYEIGFMPIDEPEFASYMREYTDEIEAELETIRKGRCIIGYKDTGEPIICPRSHKCKNCPKKGTLERFNPKHIEYVSLEYEYDGKRFDIPDVSQPSVEDQAIENVEPSPSKGDLEKKTLAHFEKESERYATIIRLKILQQKQIRENAEKIISDEEIIQAIGLKSSRGYQEIQNAYEALCDYLQLGHLKKKR